MVPIVSKIRLPEPRNEAQLRELSRLSDTQSRVDAYREACEEAVFGARNLEFSSSDFLFSPTRAPSPEIAGVGGRLPQAQASKA